MKKIMLLGTLLIALLMVSSAIASDLDDNLGSASVPGLIGSDQRVWDFFDYTRDDLLLLERKERTIKFMPQDFVVNSGSVTMITGATKPGLATNNSMVALVWADGVTSWAEVSFKVPTGYYSGGAFRVFCADSTATSSRNLIDFKVFVNGDDTAWDTSATNQAAQSLASTIVTHPDLVTLTVSTDFASLAAGDLVTLQIVRDDTQTPVLADLEVYYVEYYDSGK